jgi:hypothetical protein
LPDQPQGEGITIDGPKAVVDSEGAGTSVYAVNLPPVAASTPRPSQTPERHAVSTSNDTGKADRTVQYLIVGLVALVVLIGVTVRAWLRRASARRR